MPLQMFSINMKGVTSRCSQKTLSRQSLFLISSGNGLAYNVPRGINDPVILLGVLFRMKKLEGRGLKYSSQEFADELVELSNDISDSIGVDLARRTGGRNIIRNSGQYWKAVGLIPDDSRGLIRLTEFGRRVAEHDISQTEFSAITVQTFQVAKQSYSNSSRMPKLGKPQFNHLSSQNYSVRNYGTQKRGQGYLTTTELTKIIIPLSGCHAQISDYVNFVLWYRTGRNYHC